MAKVKTTFFCQNCGAQSPKWTGKCPSCGEWNTYVEEIIQKEEYINELLVKHKEAFKSAKLIKADIFKS